MATVFPFNSSREAGPPFFATRYPMLSVEPWVITLVFAPVERDRMAGVSPKLPKSRRPLISDSLKSGPFGKAVRFTVSIPCFLSSS